LDPKRPRQQEPNELSHNRCAPAVWSEATIKSPAEKAGLRSEFVRLAKNFECDNQRVKGQRLNQSETENQEDEQSGACSRVAGQCFHG
jgi:hypothetical protein